MSVDPVPGEESNHVPGTSKIFRLRSLGAAVVAAYGIIMFVGIHGAGPVGLLLVLGWKSHFFIAVLSGWVGIVSLVMGLAPRRSRHSALLFVLSIVAFFVSWAGILLKSEEIFMTLLSSIPFVLLSVWFGMRSFQYVGSFEGNP
jgi:hypothetical protein